MPLPPAIHLNPHFSNTIAGPSKRNDQQPQSVRRPPSPTGGAIGCSDEATKPVSKDTGKVEDEANGETHDLMDVIGQFVNAQRLQSPSSGPKEEMQVSRQIHFIYVLR